MSEKSVMQIGDFSIIVLPSVHPPLKTAEHFLKILENHHAALQGATVMDMGCGSGVLSLQMAKLGAKSVLSVDLNPIAIQNTRLNWENNQIHLNSLYTIVSNAFLAVPVIYQKQIDFIISNPPVQPVRFSGSAPNSRTENYHWNESGEDGRELLDILLTESLNWLKPGGCMLFSTSSRQGWKQTRAILEQYRQNHQIQSWRIAFEELQVLEDFQQKYVSYWLEVQSVDDPRIFFKAGKYYHQSIFIEVLV